MGIGMIDGLKSGEVKIGSVISDSVLSTAISGTTTAIGTGELGAGELGSGAVTEPALGSAAVGAVHIGAQEVTANKQSFIGGGSPPAAGDNIQVGDGVMVGGSQVINFGKKYEAAPYCLANNLVTTAVLAEDTCGVNWVVAGSALITGSPATGSFTWIAIGSGDW